MELLLLPDGCLAAAVAVSPSCSSSPPWSLAIHGAVL